MLHIFIEEWDYCSQFCSIIVIIENILSIYNVAIYIYMCIYITYNSFTAMQPRCAIDGVLSGFDLPACGLMVRFREPTG